MNGLAITGVALLALANLSEATFIIGTTAAATTGTTIAFSGGSAAALGLLGGAVLLKGLVLGAALLASRKRGRRDVEDTETEAAFAILTNTEPAQCYRRLICDLAAGAVPDNDKILSLFNDDVSPLSTKFEYSTAAKVGKMVRNANLCEVRYSCPLSTMEIQKLFA
jgi:hypothetical protein